MKKCVAGRNLKLSSNIELFKSGFKTIVPMIDISYRIQFDQFRIEQVFCNRSIFLLQTKLNHI